MSESLQAHGLQHTRLPWTSSTLRAFSKSCPLSQWWHPIISSSVVPFFSCLQSFLPVGSFPVSQFFASGGQMIGASASASVFVWLFRTDFLYDWLVWSPCNPRDSQESSPIPHFKSISSLALSFVYVSTLTSIHDYWKNHTFNYMDFCQQSNISAF